MSALGPMPDGPAPTITIGGDAPTHPGVDAVVAVRKAKALVSQALTAENDHADALLLEKAQTILQQYLAAHQDMVDNPSKNPARTIRKFSPGY